MEETCGTNYPSLMLQPPFILCYFKAWSEEGGEKWGHGVRRLCLAAVRVLRGVQSQMSSQFEATRSTSRLFALIAGNKLLAYASDCTCAQFDKPCSCAMPKAKRGLEGCMAGGRRVLLVFVFVYRALEKNLGIFGCLPTRGGIWLRIVV